MPAKQPSFPYATPLKPRKRALIIGASSGMGAALSKKLAREGYDLALVARREGLLSALCDEINQENNGRARYYLHNVSDYSIVPDVLRRIVSDLGGLDLVVYAAGVNFAPQFDEYNTEQDHQMLEINLFGAFVWLNPVAALFQSAKSGQIVGLSSVAGERGRVGNPGYNASKAGLTSYLESLRNRLTRHGVNVLTVKAGFVQTEMLKAAQRVMFPIPPEDAAQAIWKAVRARKQVVYVPWFWGGIMFVIRNIPSIVFRRMSF
ncbi:MAG TPA: SDR family NAD(P)-dependent oxidoreductase [Anaerolineales bacterium]|nr:SDR family NAD(P)-dependent oxidoreductase [Anaerolineales bacterium]